MRATIGGIVVVGVIGLALGVMLSQTACRAPATEASMAAERVSTATDQIITSMEGHELFTAHCAPCHGATGRGKGPAAIALDVAPRDFLHERFRYVSTVNGVPTDEDLDNSIMHGRRFGGMPANPQLTNSEVQALASYIREIQRLGWVNTLRKDFADDEDTTPEDIEDISHMRVKPRGAIQVSRPGFSFKRNTDKGRELYGENCASCHGLSGRGDGLAKPLDEQGKPITVRDLTSGKFRGGTTIDEIFKRIRCGIPGTPMSAATALTEEEVWQLVYYVRYLAGR